MQFAFYRNSCFFGFNSVTLQISTSSASDRLQLVADHIVQSRFRGDALGQQGLFLDMGRLKSEANGFDLEIFLENQSKLKCKKPGFQ